MDIQEMIMRNAEDKKTLEELKEKVLDGERKVFSAILEEIAEKTGASFENNKLNTFSGVFRIGYPYADSQRLTLLYYNVKKNGEESSRCSEHIHFGGGSYSDKLIAWSNKAGSKTFDKVEDAVQYIIDKYIG